MSTSNKGAGVDTRLQNLTNALYLDEYNNVTLRTQVNGLSVNITAGNVSVDKVKIWDGTNYLTFDQPNNDGEPGQPAIPVENYNYVWNGGTWDRMRGNTTDGVLTKVTNFPASQAVTGTFWQSTQPVSIASMPTTPVTGTFWQATQPVSIASMPTTPVSQNTSPWVISKDTNANASNNPIYVNIGTNGTVSLAAGTTVGVTGTFWQATQPVSGTVSLSQSSLDALEHISVDNFPDFPTSITANQGNATAGNPWKVDIGTNGTVSLTAGTTVGVTGTFWQSTQPVSIASMPTTPVTGTFWQATQPVSIASMPTTPVTGTFWQATQPVSGTVALDSTTLTALETITVNQGTAGTNAWKVDISTNGTVSLTAGTTVEATQGTNPWIISKNNTANSSSNPINVAGTFTLDQTSNVPALVKYIDTTNIQLDMTERLRVAPPTQSWWYAPSIDKDGDLRYIEAITGTNASSVFVQNLAGVRLTSGSDNAGSVIRLSRRRHKMRPGVSIQYLTTLSFHGARTNVTKQAGMFTNFNGIFYEVSGGTLWAVIRRRLTDGTLIEKRVDRANFNYDKLDGTGESGFDFTTSLNCNITSYISKSTITINTTTNQYCYNVVFGCDHPETFAVGSRVGVSGITPVTYNTSALVQSTTTNTITLTYVLDPGVYSSMSSGTLVQTALHKQYVYGFDFSGSRTTRVRFFMDTPKGKTVLHIEDFSGALSTSFENAPAMSTRYQIFNTGPVSTCAAMTVCSEAVNVEAELELNPGFGVAHNLAHPVTYIKQNNGTEWAVLAVGLRAGEPYQRADLQIQGLQIADKGNINPQNAGLFYWRLVLNPTIVGTMPTPTNIGKATRKWEFTGSQTISGGIELLSGLTTSVTTIDTRTALNFINLGSNIDYSDADKVVLSVQQVVGGTDNGSIIATINFIEAL